MIEIGQFENEQLKGKGTRIYSNEIIFEISKWKRKEKYPKGNLDIIYEKGIFNNGKLHGKGKRKLRNGKMICGIFENGQIKIRGKKQYFAQTLSHKTIVINLSEGTVNNLKRKIQNKEGIPFDHQRLIFAGRELEDDHSFKYYGIKKNSTIHLVTRLSGD